MLGKLYGSNHGPTFGFISSGLDPPKRFKFYTSGLDPPKHSKVRIHSPS